MELTPGERAVLGQIRVLYSSAGARDQQVKALLMQWPPTHYEAYRRAYGGLLAKALIQDAGAQSFRITDAGLRAIGVAMPRPTVQISRPVEKRQASVETRQPAKPKRSAFSRLVTGLLGRKK